MKEKSEAKINERNASEVIFIQLTPALTFLKVPTVRFY